MPKKLELNEDEFRRQWAGRVPLRDMASHFGCTIDTIYRRSRSLGLPHRQLGSKAVKPSVIARLYQEQMLTSQEIAKKVGISTDTVCRVLHLYKVAIRRRSLATDPTTQAVAALARRHLTGKQIQIELRKEGIELNYEQVLRRLRFRFGKRTHGGQERLWTRA